MTYDLLLGGLAFLGFTLLWVVLPHWLRKRRPRPRAAEGPREVDRPLVAEGPRAVAELRPKGARFRLPRRGRGTHA